MKTDHLHLTKRKPAILQFYRPNRHNGVNGVGARKAELGQRLSARRASPTAAVHCLRTQWSVRH